MTSTNATPGPGSSHSNHQPSFQLWVTHWIGRSEGVECDTSNRTEQAWALDVLAVVRVRTVKLKWKGP